MSATQSTATTQSTKTTKGTTWELLLVAIASVGLLQVLYYAGLEAYKIRLYAIDEFGLVIHEFDPYFNFRATVYLLDHGWKAFSQWFDYMVWYPLGRPVGTTIYPGMQVTAVLIKQYLLPEMSINDICCLIPAWFGVTATLAVAWLTFECTFDSSRSSRQRSHDTILNNIPIVAQIHQYVLRPLIQFVLSWSERLMGTSWGLRPRPTSPVTPLACATAAACIMSVVPAHLLRSVGGGYDNESIAMTAMVTTFACWTCALRDESYWTFKLNMTTLLGALTGVAYFYMVAAWGGYVFVLNMIGVHASTLVLLGRYSTKLHRAYTAFYLVGTILAIQVPVVGWTPLKSLEQLGPLLAFCGMQVIEACEIVKRSYKLTPWQAWKLRFAVFGAGAVIVALVSYFVLAPTGYFGPVSARVRGLFVKHTKTGNPLVDSVAEHQAASAQAYYQYLNVICYVAPVGAAAVSLFLFNDSSSFLVVYSIASYYFSLRMVRLILLVAPTASVCGGIAIGRVISWMFNSLVDYPADAWTMISGGDSNDTSATTTTHTTTEDTTTTVKKEASSVKTARSKAGKNKKGKGKTTTDDDDDDDDALLEATSKAATQTQKSKASTRSLHEPAIPLGRDPLLVKGLRLLIAALALYKAYPHAQTFYEVCHQVAQQISHPTIINKGRRRDGEVVVVDDYREAYWWLRDNTPEDARIMAWWDYGYQITGIGNRTTIADGNTWNHEHIALLGRILTSPLVDAHRIARHLADYVLVWAGGGGDDVAKSPHLRRIANSVYRGLCQEPTCRDFGFYSNRQPSPAMEASLLYKLHSNGIVPDVVVDSNRFREVFASQYGKVRIYKIMSVSKESKAWVADPANRLCDVEGSWFCPGQYPPALQKILKDKKDFQQLEDFNRMKDGNLDDSDYQKEYFQNLLGDKNQMAKNPPGADASNQQQKKKKKSKRLAMEEIEMLNEQWQDNKMTTYMWELIHQNRVDEIVMSLEQEPRLAHIRSEDGRGPMFWAHEGRRTEIIELLKSYGVTEDRKDEDGYTPLDLSKKRKT